MAVAKFSGREHSSCNIQKFKVVKYCSQVRQKKHWPDHNHPIDTFCKSAMLCAFQWSTLMSNIAYLGLRGVFQLERKRENMRFFLRMWKIRITSKSLALSLSHDVSVQSTIADYFQRVEEFSLVKGNLIYIFTPILLSFGRYWVLLSNLYFDYFHASTVN